MRYYTIPLCATTLLLYETIFLDLIDLLLFAYRHCYIENRFYSKRTHSMVTELHTLLFAYRHSYNTEIRDVGAPLYYSLSLWLILTFVTWVFHYTTAFHCG